MGDWRQTISIAFQYMIVDRLECETRKCSYEEKKERNVNLFSKPILSN